MKPSNFLTRVSVLVVVAFMLFSGSVMAQTSNGTIVGAVTDKTGGAIANASVKVASLDRGGEIRTATTDAAGTYRLSSLLPGKYTVTIEAGGFAATVINDLDVRASLETNASAVLEVSTATSTVTVEANVGQELQTQSGEISGNLATAEIENLPYFSGNPLEVLLTEPGVQASSSRDAFTSNGVGFSANGARPRGNNFLLDGQDNNDSQITGQAVQTANHEAIGEVTVILNSSSAEFGRGGGAIANEVYKGGTNNWHGSAWDIIQPSKLAAIDAGFAFFSATQPPRQPVQITNTFGFSLGGPVRKNKLFFFATPQWNRFRANAGAFTAADFIPTANGVAALQQIEANEGPNANIDYLIASLGGLRGTSNGARMISAGFDAAGNPRPAVQFGTLFRGDTSIVSNSLQWSVRLDYLASDHDQLTLRALRGNSTFTPDFFNNPHELPTFETKQGGPFSNYHASWVHTVSSRMLNELRFSYGNIQFEFAPTAATLASAIGTHFTVILHDLPNPDGTAMNFGLPNNSPSSRNHQTYQFQDAFSISFGKHTLKFGGDMALVFAKDGIPVDPRGTVNVFGTKNRSCGGTNPGSATAFDCNSLTNYIDNFSGPSGTIAKFFGNTIIHPFLPNYAPYIEDTWRIKQNFTLDLGLRYEYWGTPGNDLQYPSLDSRFGQGLAGAPFPSAFAAQQQPDKNNFAPRVGLAYTPHFWRRVLGGEKTVIRAGYGIFYDGLFTNILDNTASGSPNGIAQNIVGPKTPTGSFGRGTPNATGVLAALQPVLKPSAFIETMSSHLLNPLTHQWNLNVERQLPGGFLLTTAYVGTRGEHLFVNTDMNPLFSSSRNPLYTGGVTARTNGGDSIYHAGELKLERSFSHGLLFRLGYTYSKFLDDMSDVFITSGSSSYAQNVFNQHGDRGLSSYDHRHHVALAYLYQIPGVHSGNAGLTILHALTSGWQTAGTITFSTGAPQTLYVGFDNNGDTHGNDRPFLGNLKIPINYSSACVDPASTCDSGVGFTVDGVTFTDFNSSFGTNPVTGAFTATKNDFRYYAWLGHNGNIGRNTFIAPGFQNWNLSVQRSVKFKERYAFLIRGELYNAFNHPNLGIPDLNFASQFFDNTAATINGGRIAVLWGKFSF